MQMLINEIEKEINYLIKIGKNDIADKKKGQLDSIKNLIDQLNNLDAEIMFLSKKLSKYENILKIYDLNPKIVNEPGIEHLLIHAVSMNYIMPKMNEKEKDKFMTVSKYIESMPERIKNDYLDFLQKWNWYKFISYDK